MRQPTIHGWVTLASCARVRVVGMRIAVGHARAEAQVAQYRMVEVVLGVDLPGGAVGVRVVQVLHRVGPKVVIGIGQPRAVGVVEDQPRQLAGRVSLSDFAKSTRMPTSPAAGGAQVNQAADGAFDLLGRRKSIRQVRNSAGVDATRNTFVVRGDCANK
jgi:hypothetical protein